MTRVVQAAGRLIRSAEDRGVIALFDRRFLQRPYRRHLPAEWWPDPVDDEEVDLAGHPATAAAAFFGGTAPGAAGADRRVRGSSDPRPPKAAGTTRRPKAGSASNGPSQDRS